MGKSDYPIDLSILEADVKQNTVNIGNWAVILIPQLIQNYIGSNNQ